jgi:hypothetical protein
MRRLGFLRQGGGRRKAVSSSTILLLKQRVLIVASFCALALLWQSLASNILQHNSMQFQSGGPHYEIVFVTDCSQIRDDLFSYILFHSAITDQQPGIVTRVASGCNESQRKDMQVFHSKHVQGKMLNRFKLHFSPGPPSGERSGLMSFSLQHWMRNTAQLIDEDDTIVMLLKPDMLLLHRLSHIFASAICEEQPCRVKPGLVFGQQLQDNTDDKRQDNALFEKLLVGLPAMAYFSDMRRVVDNWVELAPTSHQPHSMPEAGAFSLAVTRSQLSLVPVPFFSLSDVTLASESWSTVDTAQEEQLFPGISALQNISTPTRVTEDALLPFVLQYNQIYRLGYWCFDKNNLSRQLMDCEFPMLLEAPLTLHQDVNFAWKHLIQEEVEPTTRRRLSFILNTLIRKINEALLFLKEQECPKTANKRKVWDKHWMRWKDEGSARR